MSPELKTTLGQLPPNELVEVVQWAVLHLRDVEALELLFKSPKTEEEEVEKFWLEEAARRAQEIDDGSVELIPGHIADRQAMEALEHFRSKNVRT